MFLVAAVINLILLKVPETPHCDPWMKAETDTDYETKKEKRRWTPNWIFIFYVHAHCKDLHFLKLAQKLTISVFPGTENGWQSSFLSF